MQDNNTRRQTLLTYVFFFLVGFFINIGGAVTSTAARSLATGTAVIGYCFSAFMLGRFAGITVNGILLKIPSLDKNLYIRLIPLVSLFAVAGLQLTGSVPVLALFLFIGGIGIGCIYSTSNMILVDIYSGSRKAFHISMINFLYSAGSICSPFIAGFLLQGGAAWHHPYLAYALLVLPALLLTLSTDFGRLYSSSPAEVKDSGRMNARLWMICAAIVTYILAEFSITYWTPVYMREALGRDSLFAGSCVSAFWIAVLIGRFSAGIILRRVKPRTYILLSGFLAIIVLVALRLATADAVILVLVFLSGLFCAGLFPSIFIFGTDMSESLKRTFPTLLMLSAATGSFLAMPAGSFVKNLAGIEYVLLIPVAALVLMFVLIAGTLFRTRSSVSRTRG